MRKIPRLLLAFLLVSSVFVRAYDVSSAAGNISKVIWVSVYEIRPGTVEAFQAMVKQVRASLPTEGRANWIASSSSAGKGNEVAFVGFYNNFADIEEAEKTLTAAFRAARVKNANFDRTATDTQQSSRSSIAKLREDLSYRLDRVDFASATRHEVTVLRLKPGTAREFTELFKEGVEAHKRANIDESWAVYQVEYGAPATTYYIVRTLRSLADLDLDLQEAHKNAFPTTLRDRFNEQVAREAVAFEESRIWTVRPDISRPTESIVAANPSFWTLNEEEPGLPAQEPNPPAKTSRSRKTVPNGSITAQVDRMFAKWDKPDSPGCAVGVFREGRIIYKRGYGMSNLEHRVPITPSTKFNLASLSKQFTAAAVVLLAQQNKLSLDDNVRKHVPELPDFGAPITLRHLIHHTSGLRMFGGAVVRDDVLDMASRLKKVNFPPGEKYLYSNFGYTLLALVVERVSGRSLREFARTEIFEPLGMKNTFFLDNLNEITRTVAYSYEPRLGGGFQRLSFESALPGATTIPGASELHSTIEDLARWDRNFYEDKIGRPGLVDQLHERGRLTNGEQLNYAFGLGMGNYRGLRVVRHFGEADGFRTGFLRFPEQRLSVVLLCNAGDAAGLPNADRVAEVYLENQFPEPVPSASAEQAVELSREHLQNKVGLFWNAEGLRRYRTFLQDGKLFLLRPDDTPPGPHELESLSENRFRVVGNRAVELRFEFTESGAAARLIQQVLRSPRPVSYEAIKELAPTADELAEYAGAYLGEEIDMLFRVAAEGDRLVLSRLGSGRAVLEPIFRDTFKAPYLYLDGNWYLQFRRNSSGTVADVVFSNSRNRDFRFHKLAPLTAAASAK